VRLKPVAPTANKKGVLSVEKKVGSLSSYWVVDEVIYVFLKVFNMVWVKMVKKASITVIDTRPPLADLCYGFSLYLRN
jgi:hypothetical protein